MTGQTCAFLAVSVKGSPVITRGMESFPTCFSSESDFCSDCGSVLPPPGVKDTVTCLCCSQRTQVTVFLGKNVKTSVVFNNPDNLALLNDTDGGALNGPLIERRCSRCGCEKMVYHTRQMRSADEGQTVFFTCVQCRFQEKEDS